MKNTKNNKKYQSFNTQEMCEILKCHPNTLRQWDKKGFSRHPYWCKKIMRYRKKIF